MKIYLAGPVVTEDRSIKAQMETLEIAIKEMRSVWRPLAEEEDRIEVYRPGSHKVPNAWGIDMATWGQCVFTMDVVAIDECEWMVVADYGRQATAGTSWEAGYAFAKGIKILVVQMPGVTESSLMTQGCAANICTYADFVEGNSHVDPKNIKLQETSFERFFYERGRKQPAQILN
jgi:nucleoside 2-deoxyribosyltransferase